MALNDDIFEGMWKQAKGQVRDWWGQLTDDDLESIGGKKDKLMGALQERYGWTKAKAEDEVGRRLKDYEDKRMAKEQAADTKVTPK